MVNCFRTTHIKVKYNEDPLVDGIPKEVVDESLKIVIKRIYSKFKYEFGDIFDRICTLLTTINGQLYIIMLCEEFELNVIQAISDNTDNIVVKLYNNKKEKFKEITKIWEEYKKLSADSEDYQSYVCPDINNYIAEEFDGKVDYKGDLSPYLYKENLQKGYNEPLIAEAVPEYFIHDKPIIESLYECKDILIVL